MAKNTQLFTLFNLLKAAGDKGVTKAQAVKALGVKENSVPVYFHSLKKQFNAEIETKKNGREVVAYKLINADKVEVPQFRKGAVVTKSVKTKTVTKKAKSGKIVKSTKTSNDNGEIPILDRELEITEITDRELDDIRQQLGM